MQLGVGSFTKGSAEWAKRGEAFMEEMDFVCANVIMALLAGFMLVWLSAPTFLSRCELLTDASNAL